MSDFSYSLKELNQKIRGYFLSCDEEKRDYTWSGLAFSLDVPKNRLIQLFNLAESYTILSKAEQRAMRSGLKEEKLQWLHILSVQRAGSKIQDCIEQRRDSVAALLLKQSEYGGYKSKNEVSGEGKSKAVEYTIRLELEGDDS